MSKGQNLGELELTVLLALAAGSGPLSSREVYESIVDATGREVAVASVHVTLTRLHDKRLVETSLRPGPAGLGRQVKHFAISTTGTTALHDCRAYWSKLWRAAGLKDRR